MINPESHQGGSKNNSSETQGKKINGNQEKEKIQKYTRGKLIDQSNLGPNVKELSPYDAKEGIISFGKEFTTKHGSQSNTFFYAFKDEGGEYYEVLQLLDDLEIVSGEVRSDEWSTPQKNINNFIRNKNTGETIGGIASPRQYGDLEGWEICGVGKPVSWEIIISPDGKLYRQLKPSKYR